MNTPLITSLTLCMLLGHGTAFADHPVRERDPTAMVAIAEGGFIRGSGAETRRADERPRRTIYLNAIMIQTHPCLLYTSPSPRDRTRSRMPSSA